MHSTSPHFTAYELPRSTRRKAYALSVALALLGLLAACLATVDCALRERLALPPLAVAISFGIASVTILLLVHLASQIRKPPR